MSVAGRVARSVRWLYSLWAGCTPPQGCRYSLGQLVLPLLLLFIDCRLRQCVLGSLPRAVDEVLTAQLRPGS